MDVPHIAWDACSLRGGLGFLLSVPQSSVVTLWLEEDRRCPGGHTGAVRRTRPPEGTVLAFGQVFPPNCRHYTGHLTSVMSFQGHIDHIVTHPRKEDMVTQKAQVYWPSLGERCYLLTAQCCQVYIRPLTSTGNPFTWCPLAGTTTQIMGPRSHGATEPRLLVWLVTRVPLALTHRQGGVGAVLGESFRSHGVRKPSLPSSELSCVS